MTSLADYQQADKAARDHALALEDALAAKLRPLIKRLVTRAMRNLRAKSRVLTAAGGDWTRPDADELMNRHALDQELAVALAAFQTRAVKRVVDGIATELGISLDLKNPLMVGVLADQGVKITHISDSLRHAVMSQINDAWERGLSIPDTVALITEHATEFSASRAAMIARTEIIGTSNQASLAAVRMTGAASSKTWLATNDPQTRPDHADANGQTVPIDEPFDVGGYPMDAPGDPTGPPEETINCRCLAPWQSVSAGVLRAAMQRPFEGDLVQLVTAGGRELTATSNHPILTPRGWIMAGSLIEGDHVICCRSADRRVTAHPDVDDREPSIEQVYRAAMLSAARTQRLRGVSGDFYGEMVENEVDIALTDDYLSLGWIPALCEEISQLALAATECEVRTPRRNTALLAVGESDSVRLAYAAFGDSAFGEDRGDGAPGDAEPLRDSQGTLPVLIGGGDIIGERRTLRLPVPTGRRAPCPPDSAFSQTSMNSHRADAVSTGDLLVGDPRLVETDPIVHREVFRFHGHVYDLSTGEGAFAADEIILSNCTVVYGDSSEGPDLSGLGASGGRMTENTSTLARMVVSIEGVDYTLPQPLTEAGLRRLNPEITADHVDALLRLSLIAAATGDTSLPLGARDETWDAGKAEGAMSGAAQLAAMHFWQDPEGDPEVKASYKLPFATPDPDPHAVWAACTACAASMMGARGGVDIPDADMPGVKAKIEAMYKKAATKYQDDTITPPWMDGMNAATQPAAQPAPAGSIGEWTADPLIPYGVPTRDGRMIRAASLTWSSQLPIPLMAMLEEVHGQSMDLPASVLAGAMVRFDDSPARLAASGTFDDSDGGRAAMAAVSDGRMGISADLAVTEYEYVMSQSAIDEMTQMMDGEAPAEMDMAPSQDVPDGVVVESGDQTDMGMFVVTSGEVMGATIVPFAAFDSARIELTTLAAGGHPTHARVVMPLRTVSVVEPPALDDSSPSPREDDSGPSTGLRAASGFDVLPALDAIIAGQRAASGIAPLEALAAALRLERGEAPRPVIDAEVALALVDAISKASRDPGLTDLAAALAASAARPADAPAPIIVNPPPVTVHTPDVKVENHPADVTVNAAGKPRGLRIVRDAAGNAESYEPIEDEQ